MFPRAKLQRFNDVTSDVPPPGSYDPKFDSKVKGLTMDKMTERFVESKSVVNDSGVQRSASLNALPVFRTPLMPKRTVKKSVSTVKSKQDSSVVDKVRRNIDSDFSSSEDLTLLPDKNCDLTNLQEQLNQTFLKLEGSESKCKQLEMELAQSKEVTEMLEREKTDLLKEVDRLIEETANQNVKLLNITESCDKAEASLAERKAAVFELQQSKTELLLNIEILNGKVDQNRNEIEQSVRCCLDLEGSLAEARAQNENLLQTRVSLTNDIADLQERLNEASMQIQVREEHCETLEHAKQDLLIQVDEKLQAIDELTVKIEQSEKRSVQLESLLNESKSLVTSLEEKNTILELEHKQLEDALSAVTCKLEICESKCKALELEIEECKENFVEVENAKINLMVLVEQLKSELDSLQKALSSAEKSLEEKNELCQKEEEEKAKLHQQIKELGLLTAELNQKLQQRQQVILGLQSDLSNTSCALEEQRVEAERQATEYYAEIERICDKHNEEILLVHNDLAKSVADCEARVAQAQAEHENEAANLRDLAYKLEQQVLDERKTCKTVQKEFDEEREDHQLQLEALTNDAKKSSFLKANLECALAETKAELQSIKSSYSDLDRQMAEEIKMHKQEMASVQSKLMTCQKALVEEEQKARDTVEKLVKDSQRRISEIEISTRQALEEAEIKLEAAEAAYTQTLQQVRDDTQALVQATRTDALKEMELIKAEAEQKVCAAKEEVTTLSSKLEDINEKLQEINAVKDDLKSSNLDKDTLIVELKDRMNIMETELAQSRKHLADVENELEAVKNELEFMKKIRRNLEIIGHETLAIVNAVSKRLLDSDEEVVRLSQVNCALETTLNEQKENLTAMEEDNIRDIQDMKANLLEKVELFKQKCIDENSRLQGEIEILQESVQMYANQLVEANNQLEILSKDKEEQAVLIANLQQTTDELQATQDFLANQVEDYLSVKKSHQQLQKELGLCKDMLEKARADAADGEMEIQHREKQINDFTNQLDDLNDKVTELQGVILELETAAVESEQEVEQLERKLEQQKESALKNDWQIRELTNENVELRSQVADLKRDMEHQILSANQQVEELSSAKVDLQSQLDSLNTVLECHKMNVFKARERIETLVNVVARKESELEERAAEMSQMKDELLSKTNQLSELSVIISDKDQALLTLHQEADDLKCRFQVNNELITNMKNDIDFEVAFRKECELKITEMLQDKLGNEVLIEDLKEKVVELESSIIDKNVLISSLEEKIQESSSRFSMLKAEAEDSLKQISAAEERIDALEALRVEKDNEIAVLNSEVSQSKVDIEVQKSQITELANEVQNQTDLAKYLMTRVDENRKEVAKLEEEKMALQSEVSSLKMQIEMIQWESEESLQKAKKEVASQREEILNLTEHVERIKLDVEKEKRIGHDHNEALTEEISALKISLGAKTQEVGTIRGRVQQLEAELEQTTRRKETYKAAVVELQQAIKHSRSKMSSLEEEGKAACQKLEKEREQHFKELAALQEAAANGNSWEQRYLELEALVGPFREQLEAFESERQALALKKEAAEGEVKELAQRYAQVLGHQNHKQKIHHVIKLKEQILNLKKENERLESQARAQKRTIDKLKDDLARSTGQTRFNPALAFKSHDDSLQTRLSLASKSLLDNSGISKSFRIPSQHSTARKDKENISAFDTSTPVSTRTAAKVKDEILSPARNSPARNSPAASPATPLKEVQNQQ